MQKKPRNRGGRPRKYVGYEKVSFHLQPHLLEACNELCRCLGHDTAGDFIQALIRDYIARNCPEALYTISQRSEIAIVKDRVERLRGEITDLKYAPMPVNEKQVQLVKQQPEILDADTNYYFNGSSYIFTHIGCDEPRKGIPIPTDAFTYEWWGGFVYSMELDGTRHPNFLQYTPDEGGHNPFFPDPLAQMAKERGTIIYRLINDSDKSTFFRIIGGNPYFCDHNGYGELEYRAVGLTSKENYPNVYLNGDPEALAEFRKAIDEGRMNDRVKVMVSEEYQYWNDPEFFFNPSYDFIES